MTEFRQRVAIIHAFSRRNAGDGLLVDLTFEALAAAGIEREECCLLALDPESFSDCSNVTGVPGEPSAQLTNRLFGAAGEFLASTVRLGRIQNMLSRCNAVVAVGGGYLVTDSLVRQAGVALNHFAQLRAAARHNGPTIYLPQSIGPLHGVMGHAVHHALKSIDRVWARDDQTVAELNLPNVRRCPDLAVMKLARNLDTAHISAERSGVVLVARELSKAASYVKRLRVLEQAVPDARWAVQADMTGPRSDRSFYKSINVSDSGSLTDLLTGPTGPIVSVRLHGAIAALLAGRPAIHLAYERKGWGAYQDLGLADYVHDARTFDPTLVAEQTRALAIDPAPFFDRIQTNRALLAHSWQDMVDDLSKRLTGDVKQSKNFQAKLI